MKRHDERAVHGRAWVRLAPKRDPAKAELTHHELGGLRLAIWSEHGAGIEAASVYEGHGRRLAQRPSMPAAGGRERLPKANDTCAADGDVFGFGHGERSIPERYAFAAWVGAAFKFLGCNSDDGKATGEVEALDLVAELGHAVSERIPFSPRPKENRPAGRPEIGGCGRGLRVEMPFE